MLVLLIINEVKEFDAFDVYTKRSLFLYSNASGHYLPLYFFYGLFYPLFRFIRFYQTYRKLTQKKRVYWCHFLRFYCVCLCVKISLIGTWTTIITINHNFGWMNGMRNGLFCVCLFIFYPFIAFPLIICMHFQMIKFVIKLPIISPFKYEAIFVP